MHMSRFHLTCCTLTPPHHLLVDRRLVLELDGNHGTVVLCNTNEDAVFVGANTAITRGATEQLAPPNVPRKLVVFMNSPDTHPYGVAFSDAARVFAEAECADSIKSVTEGANTRFVLEGKALVVRPRREGFVVPAGGRLLLFAKYDEVVPQAWTEGRSPQLVVRGKSKPVNVEGPKSRKRSRHRGS